MTHRSRMTITNMGEMRRRKRKTSMAIPNRANSMSGRDN